MTALPRHQCLIYKGAPSLQFPLLARLTREKLEQGYRCVYLNSPPVVEGMRRYMAAWVDVDSEIAKGSLVMSSERSHLVDGATFDAVRLMEELGQALRQALQDGYKGLWATGDMTWELGPEIGSGRLLEYEWRLESFFQSHPEMSGVCQYHLDTLPHITIEQGLCTHRTICMSETVSVMNPHYRTPELFARQRSSEPRMELFAR